MAYCILVLIGNWLQKQVFGELRVSELQNFKDKFWNLVFYKFIFIFGRFQFIKAAYVICSYIVSSFITILFNLYLYIYPGIINVQTMEGVIGQYIFVITIFALAFYLIDKIS